MPEGVLSSALWTYWEEYQRPFLEHVNREILASEERKKIPIESRADLVAFRAQCMQNLEVDGGISEEHLEDFKEGWQRGVDRLLVKSLRQTPNEDWERFFRDVRGEYKTTLSGVEKIPAVDIISHFLPVDVLGKVIENHPQSKQAVYDFEERLWEPVKELYTHLRNALPPASDDFWEEHQLEREEVLAQLDSLIPLRFAERSPLPPPPAVSIRSSSSSPPISVSGFATAPGHDHEDGGQLGTILVVSGMMMTLFSLFVFHRSRKKGLELSPGMQVIVVLAFEVVQLLIGDAQHRAIIEVNKALLVGIQQSVGEKKTFLRGESVRIALRRELTSLLAGKVSQVKIGEIAETLYRNRVTELGVGSAGYVGWTGMGLLTALPMLVYMLKEVIIPPLGIGGFPELPLTLWDSVSSALWLSGLMIVNQNLAVSKSLLSMEQTKKLRGELSKSQINIDEVKGILAERTVLTQEWKRRIVWGTVFSTLARLQIILG